MDGEKKFLLVMIGLTIICITILYSFLFVALWQYKELVGLSLFAVLLLAAWVFLRGRLNEQDLRVIRFRHHEETPLDDQGEPMFFRSDMQVNPHRRQSV
jgi:membrane protein implicated in regulation of membrane protease activity